MLVVEAVIGLSGHLLFLLCGDIVDNTGYLQLLEILEISWNLIGSPGNF